MTTQLQAVKAILEDGQPRASHQIQQEVLATFDKWCSDAAITARIRDLRKPEYGSHRIKCTCRAKGNYIYQMVA